jgi:hypothetical protein
MDKMTEYERTERKARFKGLKQNPEARAEARDRPSNEEEE